LEGSDPSFEDAKYLNLELSEEFIDGVVKKKGYKLMRIPERMVNYF
jgi:hypothetical protein